MHHADAELLQLWRLFNDRRKRKWAEWKWSGSKVCEVRAFQAVLACGECQCGSLALCF